MQKIIIAKYDIIQGLTFDTVIINGLYVQKQQATKYKKTIINNNKTNKKIRYNRSAGHTSSKKTNTAPVYDKKAILKMKKFHQKKLLIQDISLYQKGIERIS